jgi:cell division initiation protein
MITPQELERLSFGRATFGGYDTDSVDAFLEPLIQDYTTLYKENALLKSKMKALVSKLEEYRDHEIKMNEAVATAQKTCDTMLRETEEKCARMLTDASAAVVENTRNADMLIAAEEARVEEARRTANTKIDELREQMLACVTALDRIKAANPVVPARNPEQTEAKPQTETDTMADEISNTLQNLIGTTDDPVPPAEPKHPAMDTTSKKFGKLQFGPDYDPTKPKHK